VVSKCLSDLRSSKTRSICKNNSLFYFFGFNDQQVAETTRCFWILVELYFLLASSLPLGANCHVRTEGADKAVLFS
jgi:hypothetical protein